MEIKEGRSMGKRRGGRLGDRSASKHPKKGGREVWNNGVKDDENVLKQRQKCIEVATAGLRSANLTQVRSRLRPGHHGST